ncbi:MAG: thioredoxin [Deltaproteobacteria bacterium]|nr:MAG: thioredoxin [Deltaproteobacteria bacterium]
MAAESLLSASDADFDQKVLSENLPVLLDFWGPMCGPCKALEPVLEKLSAEFKGKVKIVKVNVDESPMTAARYMVRALPTLLLVKEGKVVEQFTGRPTPPALEQFLNKHA